MTFPPHIQNAPTPRTDAQYKEYARRDNMVKCVGIEHARHLERENNYLREVMEKMARALYHHPNCTGASYCTCGASSAFSSYEQLKKDLAQ